MFRPEVSQPRLGIIFHGQGKGISDDEMALYPDVDIFSPTKCMGKSVCLSQWYKKTILPFVSGQNLCKFVLLLDNLKVQMQDDFKDSVSSIDGLLWYC